MEITLEERNYFNQLDERQQRLYVGLKAKLLGYHGVRLVCVAYNVNIKTVRKGKTEISDLSPIPVKRIRKVGGGPKKKLKPNLNY